MADPNQDNIDPGVPLEPDQPVVSKPLSAFQQQLMAPSPYGRLPGTRLVNDPNPPPPGTGYTYSTREGPNGELINSPVTYINAPGRAPIQPPQGGGMPVPDLSGLMGAAFQHLPIDQAEKAIEMATRFVGQRGYQRDLQSGLSAEQAFAKWAPMLFHSSPAGMAGALKAATPPQITPYQAAQISRTTRQDAAAAEQRRVANAFREREVNVREREKPPKLATVTVPLDPLNPDGAKISGPADDPDVAAAVKRHEEAMKPKPAVPKKGFVERAKETLGLSPANPAQTGEGDIEPAPVDKEKRVKGKKYKTGTGVHEWTGTGWKVVDGQ